MKYAVNHPWKFKNMGAAFFIGFSQTFTVVFVEVINLIILTSNYTILDIIMNFLALVVIAEFDDYFAQTLSKNPILKKLEAGEEISQLALLIQTTSSRSAQMKGTNVNVLENPEVEGEEIGGGDISPQVAAKLQEKRKPRIGAAAASQDRDDESTSSDVFVALSQLNEEGKSYIGINWWSDRTLY